MTDTHHCPPCKERQDRIEALEAALQRIAIGKYSGLEVCHISARECRSIARAALEGKKP